MATIQMHKQFADWYRTAGIEPDSAVLPKRWKGAIEMGVSGFEAVELIRLLFDLGEPPKKFIDAFRSSLQKADPAVPMQGNDNEIRVLAGAALVDTIERAKTPIADFAALAVVAAAVQNLRPLPLIPEIPEIATHYLSTRTADRELEEEDDATARFDPKLIETLTTVSAAGNLSNMAEPLQQLGGHVERLDDALARLRRRIDLQSEETNMLWWLFGGHSRDLRQQFSLLSLPAACVIAGKELADMTVAIPGPSAASAFLDRALRSVKQTLPESLLLKDAINELPEQWRKQFVETTRIESLEDVVPLINGIKISLTAPANDEWLPAFKHASGMTADATIAPSALAYQIYMEVLVCRARTE